MEDLVIENFESFDAIHCYNFLVTLTTRQQAEKKIEAVITGLCENENYSVSKHNKHFRNKKPQKDFGYRNWLRNSYILSPS